MLSIYPSRYLHLQSCNWCFNFWSGTRFHIWSYTDQLHTDRNTNRFDRWSTGDHQLRWNASDCKRWQLFRKCSRYQCQPQHSCQRYVVRWKSGHPINATIELIDPATGFATLTPNVVTIAGQELILTILQPVYWPLIQILALQQILHLSITY